MYFYLKIMIVIFALLLNNVAIAKICNKWSKSEKIGHLDQEIIDEASGIAISKKFKDRIYHVNDSGDGAFFYISNFSGKIYQKVEISNFNPKDVEDLSIGSCGKDECLYIGDIGDNYTIRNNIKFILIKEKEKYNNIENPYKILNVKYPDHSHNAEAFALHPNGDLYIITKEKSLFFNKASNARIYRLSKEDLDSDKTQHILEYINDLPIISWINKDAPTDKANYKIVTSVDFTYNGKSLFLLTYKNVIEIEFDNKFDKYNIINIKKLPQQEAISLIPGEKSFIYNTEFNKRLNLVPIYKNSCID